MPQECVFGLQNAQKFSACGGHIVIEIHLVMPLKCNFFAPAAGQHSVLVFYACLQGASTQAQNSEFLSEPAAGPNHSVFSFLHVYRAPLDKHKTLNFDPMQARKKRTLEAFTKGDFFIFRRLWRTNTY